MLSQAVLLVLLPLSLALPQPAPRAACADMMVVFARGTTEVAPLGTVAGPPFKSALQSKIGGASMSFQGVSYAADIPGFLVGGDKAGSQTMAKMVSDAVSSCPQAKVVMSGYSQGGQLVHNAAAQLPADTMAKVSSVVIFGDPDNGKPVSGASAANTKVICHAGDNICQGGATILAPHLTYGQDAGTAAAFAASAAGF